MLYKALGFAVWKGTRWYLTHKISPARLLAVAVLQARLGETIAERDRMAALAAGRRDDLAAAREREAALRARVRSADADVSCAREQLAARAAAEAYQRVEATGLHARIHALR